MILSGSYRILCRIPQDLVRIWSYRILLRILLGFYRILLGSYLILLGPYGILLGSCRILSGSYRILLGSYRILSGSYRILSGSYRLHLVRILPTGSCPGFQPVHCNYLFIFNIIYFSLRISLFVTEKKRTFLCLHHRKCQDFALFNYSRTQLQKKKRFFVSWIIVTTVK